jgi:hypothetical protein
MGELGVRVDQEMRADALFVSNSFPIPDVAPDERIAAGERTLFCYAPNPARPTPA